MLPVVLAERMPRRARPRRLPGSVWLAARLRGLLGFLKSGSWPRELLRANPPLGKKAL